MDALPHRLKALAALSFLAVALVQTWPLALHFSTHITGLTGGDAGVYLWNIWHFRHRVVDLGRSPFWSDAILPLGGTTNLALHNYTVFADLLALPLQSVAGVVASFNLVYVINVALCGFGMFLLAHRVTGRTAEAWLAGLMFAWAPYLVSRGASHFSLAAAAPLPFFLYWLDRAWSGGRARDAAAAGAAVAWAFYCDPYYAVYTAMLGAVYMAARIVRVQWVVTGRVARIIDAAIVSLLIAVVAVYVIGRGTIAIGGLTIAMRTLYTPMLGLAVLVATRVLLQLRVHVSWRAMPSRAVQLGLILAGTAAVLLAPELHALASLTATDQLTGAPVLWRSSAPGVDALAFLVPNPNHALTPAVVREWLAGQPGGFDENVASLSYVAIVVLFVAWRRAGLKPDGVWLTITLGFASLAVGPFLNVAGVRTFFPTPWALARYLPVIGEARMPQRFSILVFLGLTVLFAGALVALGRRWPARRAVVLTAIGLALAIELWPAPRPVFAADVPGVFQVLATDARPLRVLEVPVGVRDGLSSLGDFSAASQFFQTMHGKGLFGGYLSRVDERTKRAYQDHPLMQALLEISEGRTPSAEVLDAARSAAPAFIDRLQVGHVVIDRGRVTPAAREFTIEALQLERLDAPAETGLRELYKTRLVDKY